MVTLITTLIVASATLLGVVLSNRHNRQMELIKLREQTALTIRSEKREVYLELLRVNRMSIQYAIQISFAGLEQQLSVDVEAIGTASAKFERMIPELELVASREVYDLSQELYKGMTRCNEVMYTESEKRFAQFDSVRSEPTTNQRITIWKQVRGEVQKAYEQQDLEQKYRKARNQIREELGFLALDPSLVPTSDDIKKLRSELLSLDQMNLKSMDQG